MKDSINNSQFDESMKNKVDLNASVNVEEPKEEEEPKKKVFLSDYFYSQE